MEENKTLVGTTNTETTAPAAEEKTEEKPRVELTVEPNEFDDDAAVIFLTGSQLRENDSRKPSVQGHYRGLAGRRPLQVESHEGERSA